MSTFEALTGDHAVAVAMRQINPDVVAAYPITPQTETVELFAEFVANGQVDTALVAVESEHSAMSCCIGAAAGGARVMTATSANGLALMWETLYVASGSRCPIVMSLVNRALSAPINIHCDHSDVMGMRDAGWIILFSEDPQEAYDNIIQAVRIAEHPDVLLPVVVCQDGFITSHSMERVEVYDDSEVKGFLGEYKPQWPLLDIHNPKTYGSASLYEYYYEHKRQQVEAMDRAQQVVLDVAAEFGERFGKRFGRAYHAFDAYRLDDAEVAIVATNSTAGTVKVVVDGLRDRGMKVGLLKLRAFRPFPAQQIADALRPLKAVAVMDRSISFGATGNAGPLFLELVATLALHGVRAQVADYVYGIGGRDILPRDIEQIYHEAFEMAQAGQVRQPVTFLNVRE